MKRLSTVRFSWMMMTTCLMCDRTSDSNDPAPASSEGAAVHDAALATWQVPAVPPPGVTTQRARRRQPGPSSSLQADPSAIAAWQVPALPPLAVQAPLAAQSAPAAAPSAASAPTPEQVVDKMSEKLSLTADQKAKITPLRCLRCQISGLEDFIPDVTKPIDCFAVEGLKVFLDRICAVRRE